ncbi:MAG: PIG-L family deacetylase [Lachnospiraceae bacterium]|jgi:LmbE family N-acetylglucosaminyl deacetylase|nr:PIG-L family deacetylase [Lachnospiraceae bacterium]
MSCLIVVAHPDDEVLGAGATIYNLIKSGKEVNVCILSGDVLARRHRPETGELNDNIDGCMKQLGIKNYMAGNFPNIAMNTVPHLELVEFIETAIIETSADMIITHHPADLNNDHLNVSLACQAAARVFQRRENIPPLLDLLFMEVPSATEWGLNASLSPFTPNTFVEVFADGINKKIEALSEYKGVMRDYPHPRSEEAIRALAAYRGGQAGVMYAEAFQSVYRLYKY